MKRPEGRGIQSAEGESIGQGKRRKGRRFSLNGVSKKAACQPGASLVMALFRAAHERGEQLQELALQLGVTYGYLAQLRNGVRQVIHISQDFCQACAAYLAVPPIIIKIMAGKITTRDFVSPTVYDEAHLDAALKRIEADALLGAMMPKSVWTLDESGKAFIVACYEEATRQELIPTRMLPQFIENLERATAMQESLSCK